MKIEPLNYGVSITKLDLSKCLVSQLKNIVDLCVEERLVVLKGQKLSIERFDEINEIWGIHQPPNMWASHKQYPRILRVTNRKVKGNKKGLFHQIKHFRWHCNGTFAPDPEECISLLCVEAAKSGGLTYFADGVYAYEMLTKKEKEELESVSIFLTNNLSKTFLNPSPYGFLSHEQKDLDKMSSRSRHYAGGEKGNPHDKKVSYFRTNRTDLPLARKKTIEKKLIVKHPLSGKKGLYFPFFHIFKMQNSFNPSLCLKQYFHKLIECYVGSKGKIYSHQWVPGDIILSDQVHSLHRRDPFEGFRELYRTAFWYHNPIQKSGV